MGGVKLVVIPLLGLNILHFALHSLNMLKNNFEKGRILLGKVCWAVLCLGEVNLGFRLSSKWDWWRREMWLLFSFWPEDHRAAEHPGLHIYVKMSPILPQCWKPASEACGIRFLLQFGYFKSHISTCCLLVSFRIINFSDFSIAYYVPCTC